MFKSHTYQVLSKSGSWNRSRFEAGLGIVLTRVSIAFFAFLLQHPGAAHAQEPEAREPVMQQSEPGANEALSISGPVDLEQAFWLCDYIATRQTIDMRTVEVCSGITEALKMAKFNGDFDAMLTWWQRNKATEHAALQPASEADPLP